jgi:LPXTG-site transpeptidase (sortase) family protein
MVPGGSNLLRFRKLLPGLLIVLGSFLLAYVASQYGTMYSEQKRMAEAWDEQQARQTEEPASAAQAHEQKDDGLIRLAIPKIDLTSFIVEGTSHKALLLGPGHMTRTAEPGEPGNAVISGHRDTFFRHLYQLEKGDQVLVERGGRKYIYQVTGKKIVEPNDLSVIRPTSDPQMTLITCYPTYYIGPAPKRLVVFSKLAEQGDLRAGDSKESDSGPQVQTAGISTATAGH